MKIIKLNEKLIKEQEVSYQQRSEIVSLHKQLKLIFKVAKKAKKKNILTYTTGKIISDTVLNIEYALQSNWNFPLDANYHKYQNDIPGCTCPREDNKDTYGSPIKWLNVKCKFHGNPGKIK